MTVGVIVMEVMLSDFLSSTNSRDYCGYDIVLLLIAFNRVFRSGFVMMILMFYSVLTSIRFPSSD